ncbi:transposase family protein [Geodermatophilus sp. TF02-6]|uniref:transposase family protein n=1 Tax=Geodermatophilus sp. TF02-6 TaxID=2250575 RepID=UPI001314D22E|nr:transposase family protein [Geodermatophilus sp. TF02-6]
MSIDLLWYLIAVLGPRWRGEHPQRRRGRRRASFVDLLAGTLVYLRQSTSFRAAAAAAHLPRSTLHDAFGPIVAMIAELGICQADGTLLREEDLQQWCAEMAEHGELVLLDGTATRCPRPGASWAAQKPMWDAKHRCHATNTETLTTEHGDLLAVHGGWPGSVPEADQARHSSFIGAVLASEVAIVTDAGFRSARADLHVICRAGNHKTPQPGDREITRARAENERPHALLKSWRIMDRTRITPLVKIHAITSAVLVGLQTYGHRRPDWP